VLDAWPVAAGNEDGCFTTVMQWQSYPPCRYDGKYYGMKAADEKNLLAGYLNTNNGTGIKAKLDEYKKWWVVNKDKAINL
jgi:hypothetical protein